MIKPLRYCTFSLLFTILLFSCGADKENEPEPVITTHTVRVEVLGLHIENAYDARVDIAEQEGENFVNTCNYRLVDPRGLDWNDLFYLHKAEFTDKTGEKIKVWLTIRHKDAMLHNDTSLKADIIVDGQIKKTVVLDNKTTATNLSYGTMFYGTKREVVDELVLD